MLQLSLSQLLLSRIRPYGCCIRISQFVAHIPRHSASIRRRRYVTVEQRPVVVVMYDDVGMSRFDSPRQL